MRLHLNANVPELDKLTDKPFTLFRSFRLVRVQILRKPSL